MMGPILDLQRKPDEIDLADIDAWARPRNRTSRRLAFDILAGIALPIACLLLDPFIFRPDGPLDEMAPGGWVAGQAFIIIEVVSLAVWLAFRNRLTWFAGVIAGVLLVGTVVAAAMGVLLLPLTGLGLASGVWIAALGLSPFFVTPVFGRNTGQAVRRARETISGPRTALAALAGAFFVLGATVWAFYMLRPKSAVFPYDGISLF